MRHAVLFFEPKMAGNGNFYFQPVIQMVSGNRDRQAEFGG